MSKILVVDDDPLIRRFVQGALASEGHTVLQSPDGKSGLETLASEQVDLVVTDFIMPGMDGVEFMERLRRSHPHLKCVMVTAYGTPDAVLGALREQVCGFLVKPFTASDLIATVTAALAAPTVSEIEIISARPEWVELRIPCNISSVPTLQKMLTQLKADLPEETREEVAYAFREMLNNAIEYGGKFDPSKYVTVSYVRLKHAIIYRIKDPGEGFDPEQLEHAAVSNPKDDLLHHSSVRDTKGLRPGGFGIMLTSQLVDELIYNEHCNELMFVKYL